MSTKLSETQFAVLGAAGLRSDRCLVAAPNLKGGAAQKVAAKLIAANLVREIRAKGGAPVWRRDADTGEDFALKLMAAGMKAIIAKDELAPKNADIASNVESASPIPTRDGAPREGSKLAAVVSLMRRINGAPLAELMKATGWLAHTTRAAITGLRKRGFAVVVDRSNKQLGTTYRIEDAAIVESAEAAASREAPKASKFGSPKSGRSNSEHGPGSRIRRAA